jgi:hypothetical protein
MESEDLEDHTRAPRFNDKKPGYSYLRKLFRDLLIREGYQYYYMSDWRVQRDALGGGCHTPETMSPRSIVVPTLEH